MRIDTGHLHQPTELREDLKIADEKRVKEGKAMKMEEKIQAMQEKIQKLQQTQDTLVNLVEVLARSRLRQLANLKSSMQSFRDTLDSSVASMKERLDVQQIE